ncbi:unnamed protein product [Diamesa tonsa]
MSSVRALKRKQKNHKENNPAVLLERSKSCNDLNKLTEIQQLRKINSDCDVCYKADYNKKEDIKFTSRSSKSERCLKTIFARNSINNFLSSTPSDNPSIPSTPTYQSSSMIQSSFSLITDSSKIRIPICGYEVMEERARFTIFKLRIENYESNNFWLVLRRFTDFTRLHNKLKSLFPNTSLVLPKKKWFGNNFSSGFIDNRIAGLQTFINTILQDSDMRCCPVVREFFCLDEPPTYSESMEETKAIFEAQEETIAHLKMQLKSREDTILNMTHSLLLEKENNRYLSSLVKHTVERCEQCADYIQDNFANYA